MDINDIRAQATERMNELNKELAKYQLLSQQYAVWYLSEKGTSISLLARAYGVTPVTIYKWIDKVRKEQDGGERQEPVQD